MFGLEISSVPVSLPSAQKEMMRYISSLKTEESRTRNIERAICYLLGKGLFIGRKML
jgi:hypothetical protein